MLEALGSVVDRGGHGRLARRRRSTASRSSEGAVPRARRRRGGRLAIPTSRRWFDEVVERVLEGDRELLTILTGEGAPRSRALVDALERASPRRRASTCTTGGSRTTRSSSSRSDRRRSRRSASCSSRTTTSTASRSCSCSDALGAIEVVGAVADGAPRLRAWRELAPDVVVLDYRLPDVDGAQVAADLRARTPDAAVVFLSASAGEDEYDAASSAGAALVRKDDGNRCARRRGPRGGREVT